MSKTRSVIIVGSGPAGYTAAIYSARAGLAPLVIAGSVTAGGALMNTTEVENFPGFVEGVQGPDLMADFRAQAERFGADVLIDDAVSLDLVGSVKRVTTGGGRVIDAHSVILAMGSVFRELGLADEKRLSGRGVSWCATCDGFFYRDRPVAVIGGGDSAIEEATFLTRFASKVYLIHRRDALRASKIMADRAQSNPKIEFVWNSEVIGLDGDDKLTGVQVRDVKKNSNRTLEVDGLFVAIGHDPRSELVKGVVETDVAGYVQVLGRTTVTNIPGVFACGDLVDSRYRQAITAAGSGCAAALDTQHYLDNLVMAEMAVVAKPAVVAEPVPVEEVAPVVEAEPVPVEEVTPVVEAEPVVEAAPVVEAEPGVEAAPVVEAAPMVEAEPVVEAAPMVEDPIVKDGPIVKEPPAKPTPARPSLVRKSPPIESEPEVVATPIELEPVVAAKPVRTPKRVDPVLGLARPIDVTESNFEVEALRSDLPVVVDFWASWCAPCRAVAPILDQLAKEYAGRIKVIKVDADANPTLAAEYKVITLPSIVVLKDGAVISLTAGFRGRDVLEKAFSSLVK